MTRNVCCDFELLNINKMSFLLRTLFFERLEDLFCEKNKKEESDAKNSCSIRNQISRASEIEKLFTFFSVFVSEQF
jgi:hypothetical protein